ncbi:MAG: UDP-galactopyranose mutase [Verrucomicrobia bacterium]|nr:UDP-galactopyranose mutase [Verrucomicrobiota bacterium]
MKPAFDLLITGAGFAGAVLAERFARVLGKSSLVIDRRTHVAGNAFDEYDRAGVLVHRYGPHYFRTNSERVRAYLSQFTEWRAVEYKILAFSDGRFWNFPINLNTFEQLLGRPSSTEEMDATLAKWRVPLARPPRNSEEVIVAQVGRELYEKFFKHYTRKQWRRDPSELDPGVCGRIPVRTNRDNRYLTERFQALPADGYTPLIQRMLDHPKIEVRLGTSLCDVIDKVSFKHLVYSGPVDEFFRHRFGPLPYRSLRFEPETLPVPFFQPAVQVNYPNDFEFTRIVETKHITGQVLPVTTIVREYPEDYGPGREPYYPIPTPEARAAYGRYAQLAAAQRNVSFIGRLATYRYCNMDQVVAMALTEFNRLSGIDSATIAA